MQWSTLHLVSICGDGHHPMGDTMLGDPYRQQDDHWKTTKKQVWAFDHGTGTPSIMQSVRHSIIDDHFHVLLTIQFSCQHLDLWVGTCWIIASIRWAAFPPVAEEETWVYDGLWPFGAWDISVQLWTTGGRSFRSGNRYTTILNSGILKVIQFKHGTLGSLGPQHWGFCAAVTSQQEWGPDVDTTTADWSTTNSWNVQPRSLHGDVVAIDPLKWCGLPWKHSGWQDGPLVMTRTGWGEDLNVVYVKFIWTEFPFQTSIGKSPIYSMYVVCTFATLQYRLDVFWIP